MISDIWKFKKKIVREGNWYTLLMIVLYINNLQNKPLIYKCLFNLLQLWGIFLFINIKKVRLIS